MSTQPQKAVAIVQSNYIPWKGYFDMIARVDEFILLDDAQYTRRDWRNRNRIKTAGGTQWLTIPTQVKGMFHQKIKDVEVSQPDWAKKHWRTLLHNYAKAPHFDRYRDIFEPLYMEMTETHLSRINLAFIQAICGVLAIDTKISWSMDYGNGGGEKTERLVELCTQANATVYLSGPSAKDYMENHLFERVGIQLTYMDYSGYPEYHQRFDPFDHAVSILDLIFNEGPKAPRFMKGF